MQSFKIVDDIERLHDSASFESDGDQMIKRSALHPYTSSFIFPEPNHNVDSWVSISTCNKLVLSKILIIKHWAKNICFA